jgi:hypothetical protein
MRGRFGRVATTVALIALELLTRTATAATLTYNYSQDWMYDSATGLYWQTLQIPITTFAPDHGTIATESQVLQLSSDAGMSGIYLLGGQQTATYSQSLANFLSFLEFDAPARSAKLQKDFNFSAVYYYPADTLYPDQYEYSQFEYTNTDRLSTQPAPWDYFATTTLGDYGPPPGPACPDFTNCPAFEPAYIVSTVQPVPLPGSVTSIVGGILVLGLIIRRKLPRDQRASLL